MLFSRKPHLYFQFLDRSIRYLVLDPFNNSLIEKEEIVFETDIIQEGKIASVSLLETRLDALVKEKKWKNAKASILLPNDYVTIREETIPIQLSESEIKDYIALHLDQSIRLPFENPKFDFEIIEKNGTSQKVMIIAYPSDQIVYYQALLQNVSLKPVVADIPPLSLYRIMNQQKLAIQDDKHILLLQWNPFDTAIMVFHQGIPKFNRHSRSARLADAWFLSKNGEWNWRESKDYLDTMLDEQLDSLERFLDFYRYSVLNGEASVTDIILTGYYPDLDALKSRLTNRFSVNVHMLSLPESIEQRFAALHGLSLKEKNPRQKKTEKMKQMSEKRTETAGKEEE